MDGGAWWAAVYGVATEQLHFHFLLSRIGEGNGNPLQCSCLENPRDGGAWWAAVYGVAQSRTRLKRLSSSSSQLLVYMIFTSQCTSMLIHVQLFVTLWTLAHQVPVSMEFSRQEHWSGLPFPSPMRESEKWKWSCSVVSDSRDPMDWSLAGSSIHGIFQAKVLEWGAIAFSSWDELESLIFWFSVSYSVFLILSVLSHKLFSVVTFTLKILIILKNKAKIIDNIEPCYF